MNGAWIQLGGELVDLESYANFFVSADNTLIGITRFGEESTFTVEDAQKTLERLKQFIESRCGPVEVFE